MTLRGSLDELPLSDLIQLFAISGRTGRVDLTHGDESGQVFLRGGQVVHAIAGGLEGEEAIHQLVTWSDGSFHFSPGHEPSATTITKANDNLLIEAAHRVDEWAVLSKSVGSLEQIPVLCPGVKSAAGLDADRWALCCWIDGRRSLAEIAIALDQTALEIYRLIQDLAVAGRLVLQNDPLQDHHERLASLERSHLLRLIDALDTVARSAVDQHQDLDRNLGLCQEELRRGRALDAVCDLVRGHGRALYEIGGAVAMHSFLEEVSGILKQELA